MKKRTTIQTTKQRREELFSAEMILRRVYLHLQHCDPVNMAAAMLVAVRHQEITKEARELRRAR